MRNRYVKDDRGFQGRLRVILLVIKMGESGGGVGFGGNDAGQELGCI